MKVGNTQPILGRPINASHPLAQGLVGCWLLNEGGGQNAFDSTRRNGSNGILTNGAVYKQTARGNAVLFDGSDDFITIPSTSSNALTNDFTISAWVNFVSFVHAINQVLMKNNANTSFYGMEVANTGRLVFQCHTTSITATSASALVLGSWYHICCTRAQGLPSANTKMYINGVKNGTVGTQVTNLNTSTTALTFGTDAVNAGRQGNLLMNDVKIYNRALSETEVMQLYTNSYAMFQNARPLKLAI